MKLELSPRDQALYAKLYASVEDILFARRCAEHIRNKGWNKRPWSRGSVYFQQSAFVTALVVSYARPFGKTRGGPNLPKRLIRFDDQGQALHDLLIRQRNQIYAHSDLEHWNVRPWRSGDFETAIVGQPIMVIEPNQIDAFLAITTPLIGAMQSRMASILADYPPSPRFDGGGTVVRNEVDQ